jgi:hypothetical protein
MRLGTLTRGWKKWMGLAAALGLLVLAGLPAGAGPLREVVLEDGSVLQAEVVAMKDGVYTLKSEAMGQINVDESAIRAIRAPGSEPAAPGTSESGAAAPSASPEPPDMAGMRQSMMGNVMSNPNLMGMIFALRNDPQVQEVLQDPEVMEMVMAGDLQGLRDNPKFRKLMENPNIQSLTDEMTE